MEDILLRYTLGGEGGHDGRESQGSPASGHFSLSLCLTSMLWGSLSSTPSNEEVFHRILQRGCKAVGPGGPDLISLWLFQALISHYYNGKPENVN